MSLTDRPVKVPKRCPKCGGEWVHTGGYSTLWTCFGRGSYEEGPCGYTEHLKYSAPAAPDETDPARRALAVRA